MTDCKARDVGLSWQSEEPSLTKARRNDDPTGPAYWCPHTTGGAARRPQQSCTAPRDGRRCPLNDGREPKPIRTGQRGSATLSKADKQSSARSPGIIIANQSMYHGLHILKPAFHSWDCTGTLWARPRPMEQQYPATPAEPRNPNSRLYAGRPSTERRGTTNIANRHPRFSATT